MFCGNCGSQIPEGRSFCGTCGVAVRSAAASTPSPVVQPQRPAVAQPAVIRAPWSTAKKVSVSAIVILLAAAAGTGWWWVHRPAPPYRVQDPGIYPFQSAGADGKVLTGFVDANGNVVVQPAWDAAGVSIVLGRPLTCNEGMCAVAKAGKWGYINTSGQLAISTQFDAAQAFVNGLAPVKLGNLWGYIDKTGRYAINPQFTDAGYFYSGLARASMDVGWGFIGKSGSWVIRPQFATADSFSEGLASVCVKEATFLGSTQGKCGFISSDGRFTIKPQFDAAGTFSQGRATVKMDGKWGYVDRSGSIAINPQFDIAGLFVGGFAVVQVSGNQGIIGRDGKYIVNPGQDMIHAGWSQDLLAASTSDGIGLLARDGKWILQPTHLLADIGGINGKVFYGNIGGQWLPIATSGEVLAGWYKGAMLSSLAPDIQNETNALSAVRSLVGAESSYSNSFPAVGFSASLDALGPAPNGNPDEKHAGLIDATLATGSDDSYQFSISIPAGTSTGGTNFNYQLIARPLPGHAGRTFCADSTGTIRYSLQGQDCTASSPTVPSA